MSNATSTTPATANTDTCLLRFEANLDEGTVVVTATVRAEALRNYTKSPRKAEKLGSALCKALGVPDRNAYDQRSLHVLPLFSDSPFYGRWIAGSPMGMENMQPPAGWLFEERLEHMRNHSDQLAFLQGEVSFANVDDEDNEEDQEPTRREEPTSEELSAYVEQAIIAVLGANALVNVEGLAVKTDLDLAMDGDWGNFDGGYG